MKKHIVDSLESSNNEKRWPKQAQIRNDNFISTKF